MEEFELEFKSKSVNDFGIDLNSLLSTFDEWSVKKEEPKTPSRSDTRKQWAEKEGLSSEDIETLSKLLEVFNSTPTKGIQHFLTEEELDQLTDELMTIRNTSDMLSGRESAIRSVVFEQINKQLEQDGYEPDITSGKIDVPEFGVSLSKEVSGNKPSIDVYALKDILDETQFDSVVIKSTINKVSIYPNGKRFEETQVEYELDEKALQTQLEKGNIGMEQLLKATTYSTRRTAFYVRKIKTSDN